MPSVDVFRMIETIAVVTVPIFLFWLQRMMRDRDRVQEEIRKNTQDQNVRIASLVQDYQTIGEVSSDTDLSHEAKDDSGLAPLH